MATPITNFGLVTVSTTYNSSDVTITLTSGHGSRLPATTGGYTYPLTWWDATNYAHPADDPNVEIVLVTARSGDTLTVTRAQESTSASNKNTGSAVYRMSLGVTKSLFEGLRTVKNQHFGLTLQTSPSSLYATTRVVITDVDSIIMDDGTVSDNSTNGWSNLYADITVSGAGGLDTGAETANAWYGVYAICKEDGTRNMLLHYEKYRASGASYSTGDDSAQPIGSTSSNTAVAQGFKSTLSGMLSSVEVKLQRVGSPSGTITAAIYSNSAGVPGSGLISSGTILAADIPATASWLQIPFAVNGYTLSAATQYHLVLASSYTPNATDYIQWRMDGSSPTYADGSLATWNGATWTADTAKDLHFGVYVENGDSAVTMPSGYTKKCLLGYVRNSSSDFIAFIQAGRTVRYKKIDGQSPLTATGGIDILFLDAVVPYRTSLSVMMGFSGTGTSAGLAAISTNDIPDLSTASADIATPGCQAFLHSVTTSLRPGPFSNVNLTRCAGYLMGTSGGKLYVAGYTF